MDITTRYRELFNPDTNQVKIDIAGAGTVGSNLAVLLARLGLKNITVYDDDLVEDHNLGHQAFRVQDIGKPKVEALKEIILANTGTEIQAVNEKTNGIETDVLVLAVDSMSARKAIAENSNFNFGIDARMGGETFNIYSFSIFERERYASTLFSDDQGLNLACGGRSVGYIGYLVAGLMENTIKKMILAQEFPFEQNFCAKNLIYSAV